MSVQAEVLIADLDEAQAIADTDSPISEWEGFTFNGFDRVQVCTLLSLLKTANPETGFEQYLNATQVVTSSAGERTDVSILRSAQVSELAAVAELDETEIEALAIAWGSTEEFGGWSGSDVRDLIRKLGDLAESASLQGKCLMLWQSM